MATLTHTEKAFLKNLVTSVKGLLNLAWFLTVLNCLLFIYQAWLLANIFSTWLVNYFEQTSLSSGFSSSWLIGLLLCFILRPLLNSSRELLSTKASLIARRQLRTSLLLSLQRLGPNSRYFGSEGSLSSKIIDQTDALDGFISRFSVQKKVTVSTPVILLIAVAWQSKFAALLLFITAPLVPVFMILIGHLTARKSAAQFNALSQLSGRFMDWIRGMPTLKRLQATAIAEHDLAISSEDYRRRTMDVLKIAFLNGAVLELLAALSIALVAVYLGFGLLGILPWNKGEVPVAYFGSLFILLLAPEFYLPLRQLGADYHAKAQAEGAVQGLLPILQANQAKNVAKHNIQNDSFDLSKPFGITVTGISIKTSIAPKINSAVTTGASHKTDLDSAKNYRIRLLPTTFNIKAGDRVALIGASGSGKSSLIQALMGFVDYEGSIVLNITSTTNCINSKARDLQTVDLNEVDLQTVNVDKLRDHIGYLAQQVALMPLSIADNLRLANPKASKDELINALTQVELWSLIKRLPHGLDTQLGERGQGLSGGQQQRLAIAQLLLRNHSLWLLDEPTEHLDPDTAQRLHDLLERVSRDKTVIWVTHAPEKLDWLDAVIKLNSPQCKPIPMQLLTQEPSLSANPSTPNNHNRQNDHAKPILDKHLSKNKVIKQKPQTSMATNILRDEP